MHFDWSILLILVCGAIGGLVSAFIGDNSFHMPTTQHGIWQPGFIGIVFVGMIAAFGSWASLKSSVVLSGTAPQLNYGDLANALIVGFGGTKWWKSEGEKDVLQKAAATAAGKNADPAKALQIATASPLNALDIAENM